ncbi:hypothetical protein BYT27DRAFT_6926054 [Phlegmacium glaucopus]|nr:hypothetical protein BYT27DRAFT_6926054 [Phlegmacium glaucopus]
MVYIVNGVKLPSAFPPNFILSMLHMMLSARNRDLTFVCPRYWQPHVSERNLSSLHSSDIFGNVSMWYVYTSFQGSLNHKLYLLVQRTLQKPPTRCP